MQWRGVRRLSVRPCVNFCANRFFSHANGRIATKLAHDGLQVSVHPGCAQGQGQRSRDTRTFLDSWNELLRHWRSGFIFVQFVPRCVLSFLNKRLCVCGSVDQLVDSGRRHCRLREVANCRNHWCSYRSCAGSGWSAALSSRNQTNVSWILDILYTILSNKIWHWSAGKETNAQELTEANKLDTSRSTGVVKGITANANVWNSLFANMPSILLISLGFQMKSCSRSRKFSNDTIDVHSSVKKRES